MSFRNPLRLFESCASVRARLDRAALEDLSASERVRTDGHLARCAPCRVAVAERRELLSLIPRALPPVAPPPDVLLEVLDRVRGRRRLRPALWTIATSAAVAALAVLTFRTVDARSYRGELGAPDMAVINLFAALDSPLSSRYEYRTANAFRFDRSVGRILYRMNSGNWRLVVHGLPRPPRGSRYVLSALVDAGEVELGAIERWDDGVAILSGRSDLDLTRTERLSVQLVSRNSRLRLLEAVRSAW